MEEIPALAWAYCTPQVWPATRQRAQRPNQISGVMGVWQFSNLANTPTQLHINKHFSTIMLGFARSHSDDSGALRLLTAPTEHFLSGMDDGTHLSTLQRKGSKYVS